MAIWKITANKNASFSANLRFEKGMSVEVMVVSGHPLGTPKFKEMVATAFNNKYAMKFESKQMSTSYLDCEKISG